MELLRVHTWLEDLPAVEREVATALAAPELTEPVKLVMVAGARALALLEYGRLAEAADAARDAEAQARRLGFDRRALVRQILLAAAAIERGDPMTASVVAGALQAARAQGFLNTAVTTAPQLTSYLVEHATQLRPDPFTAQLITAALQARALQLDAAAPRRGLADPLTAAELRILKLLPTSTYLQIADTLYISRNTVKVHLRSVYQKLGVASRAQALERAVDLSLL